MEDVLHTVQADGSSRVARLKARKVPARLSMHCPRAPIRASRPDDQLIMVCEALLYPFCQGSASNPMLQQCAFAIPYMILASASQPQRVCK